MPHPANRWRCVSSPGQSAPRLFDAFQLPGEAAWSVRRSEGAKSVSAYCMALSADLRACGVCIEKRRRLSASASRATWLGGGCPMSMSIVSSAFQRDIPLSRSEGQYGEKALPSCMVTTAVHTGEADRTHAMYRMRVPAWTLTESIDGCRGCIAISERAWVAKGTGGTWIRERGIQQCQCESSLAISWMCMHTVAFHHVPRCYARPRSSACLEYTRLPRAQVLSPDASLPPSLPLLDSANIIIRENA